MAQRLVLVRHAHPGGDPPGRLLGSSNPPLDDVGLEQARALAGRLARFAPQRIVASPLTRARQTVAAALAPVDLSRVEWDEALREIDFGRWENRRFEEVAREDPELAAAWHRFDPSFAFPEGESLACFLARVQAVADRLAADPAETVLVVSHGGVTRAILCHLLGLEAWQYVLFHVGYTAIVELKLFDGKAVLAGLENVTP